MSSACKSESLKRRSEFFQKTFLTTFLSIRCPHPSQGQCQLATTKAVSEIVIANRHQKSVNQANRECEHGGTSCRYRGSGAGWIGCSHAVGPGWCTVTVLEKQPFVGGRTSTIEQDGFKFDLGPTFFLYPRVLAEIFQSLGRNLWNDVPMKRLDPQYRISFGAGGKLDATPDIAKMEEQIGRLAPQDVGGLTRYMQDNRRKLECFRPILETPFERMSDLLRAISCPQCWLRPWRSLATELKTYFSDPRLMIAFSFQSKYLGMSPFKCPSLFSILSFLNMSTASIIRTADADKSASAWLKLLARWEWRFGLANR